MASKPVDIFCVSCFSILFFLATNSAGDTDNLVSYNVEQSSELDALVSVLDLKSVHGNGRYRRDVDNSTIQEASTQAATTPQPPTTSARTTTSIRTTTRTETSTTTLRPTTSNPTTTSTSTQNTQSTTEKSQIKLNNHAYYQSMIVPESVEDHWVDLLNAKRHKTLSENHRTAVTIPLSFTFRFYGHNITKVTVATGGFIYASPFLHQWLTATQYIAPLMANFDTTMGKASDIFYDDFGDHFVVQWRDVFLQDQNTTEAFNFQVILMNDGTIKFLYKTLPISVASISKENHPVKIGLSDAFYIDTILKEYGVKRRTIYEYHRVNFGLDQIEQGTVIILKPLPTCNIVTDCQMCVRHTNIKFNCEWCNSVHRCSDGWDWKREEWLKRGCRHINSTLKDCFATSTVSTSTVSVTNSTLVSSSPLTATSTLTQSSASTNLTSTASSSVKFLSTSTPISTISSTTPIVSTSPPTSTTSTISSTTPTVSPTVKTSISLLSTLTPTLKISSTKLSLPTSTVTPASTPSTSFTVTPASTSTVSRVTSASTSSIRPVVSTQMSSTQSPVASSSESSSAVANKTIMTTSVYKLRKITTLATVYRLITTTAGSQEALKSKRKPECDENSTEATCIAESSKISEFPTGAVVAIVLILLMVFGGAGVWFFYAYTHPTSSSGLWLMEHRPSQMKVKMSNMKFWKSDDPASSKYAVETTA